MCRAAPRDRAVFRRGCLQTGIEECGLIRRRSLPRSGHFCLMLLFTDDAHRWPGAFRDTGSEDRRRISAGGVRERRQITPSSSTAPSGTASLSAAAFKRRAPAQSHAEQVEQAQILLNHDVVPSHELVSLMRYKRWADGELLQAVRGLSFWRRWLAGRVVAAIVRHVHAVDCIFRAHLLGVAHSFTTVNSAEPTALPELEERVRATDDWFIDYARTLDARRMGESLNVTFTDGDRQQLTRAEVLLHISHHGAYHRGNAGILLRIVGAAALPDRFTSYLRSAGSTFAVAR